MHSINSRSVQPCPDGRLLFAQVVVTIWEGFTSDTLRLGSGNLNPILAVELISCVMWRKQLQPHYNMVCVCGGGLYLLTGWRGQPSESGIRTSCAGHKGLLFWLPEAQFSAVKLLSKYSGLSVGCRERTCVEGMVLSTVLWRGGDLRL